MNHMKKIAEMLGVELEEEFTTANNQCDRFKLTQCGLLRGVYNENGEEWENEWKECGFYEQTVLIDLLMGGDKVVKKPWKPKRGEIYWRIAVTANIVAREIWCDTDYDLTRYVTGNCFYSEEEAEKYIDKYTKWLNNKEPDTSWRD